MHWNCRILYTWLNITDSNSVNFNEYFFFGNFGLYWGVPEGRNMSTIKDEEELYQSLKNLSIIHQYIHDYTIYMLVFLYSVLFWLFIKNWAVQFPSHDGIVWYCSQIIETRTISLCRKLLAAWVRESMNQINLIIDYNFTPIQSVYIKNYQR